MAFSRGSSLINRLKRVQGANSSISSSTIAPNLVVVERVSTRELDEEEDEDQGQRRRTDEQVSGADKSQTKIFSVERNSTFVRPASHQSLYPSRAASRSQQKQPSVSGAPEGAMLVHSPEECDSSSVRQVPDSLHSRQHHQHIHRVHAPTCIASKLVNKQLSAAQATARFKQHQPHCVHHKHPQLFMKKPGSEETLSSLDHHHLSGVAQTSVKLPISQFKTPQDKSYLVVKYRPDVIGGSNNRSANEAQLHRYNEALATNGGGKRTTVKFISQLYFLLHLSAILSLLLHHKNLVTSDWRAANGRRAAADEQAHSVHARKVSPPPLNESAPQPADPQQLPQPPIPDNPLPVPLMLQGQSIQLINSVVAAPEARRFGRQANGSQSIPHPPPLSASPDILVRVVGARHARCALQYFLCYLLSSSVTILVCLRLLRLCAWPAKQARPAPASANPDQHGFYYRTRLDCTPVLIGSVSLGLIQLIVIGLDVANNINWLADNRWPVYLPLLQFAFVSLLMQFILSRVAKNHSNSSTAVAASSWRRKARREDHRQVTAVALSIKDRRKLNGNNNGQMLLHWSGSPISGGLQNIALAHLLVTHILLWLMKLNSISLFQVIEQQEQHRHQHHQQQQTVSSVVVVAPPNIARLYPPPPINTQSTLQPPVHLQTEFDRSPAGDPDSAVHSAHNRTELEGMLRRKWPPPKPAGNFTGEQPATNLTRAAGELHTATANLTGTLPARPAAPPVTRTNETGESVKNERDLRSRAPPPVQVPGDQQLVRLIPGNVLLLNKSGPSVTLSQGQLLSLLSLAAKSEFVGSNEQRINSTLFKSSLPKRMTAFRQSSPPPRLPPVTSTSTTAQPASTSASPMPKQRVRILVSHSEGPQAETSPAPEEHQGDEHHRRGKQVDPPAKPASTTTERPFPSVDSDPPMSSSPEAELSALPADRRTFNSTRSPASSSTPASSEEPSESAGTSEEAEDQSEEAEPDLDSMLPPVPNYNETSSEERAEPQVRAQVVPLSDSATEKRVAKGLPLEEDPFAFNEAASTQLNRTLSLESDSTAPTPSPEEPKATNRSLATPEPVKEALVMANPRERAHEREQPSFVDYLMPIVHQYHILIIAILFNMWLDSLCEKSPQRHLSSGSTGKTPPARISSSSELSSAASASSARGLIAIPIRNNSKLLRRFEAERPSFVATGNKALQKAQELRRRSRSMDLLNRQVSLNDDNESSASSLSRYNSLRSSSSERLLWIPSNQLPKTRTSKQLPSSNSDSSSVDGDGRRHLLWQQQQRFREKPAPPVHSVCSVFFGLLVVSGSLIVITLDIELLSLLTQCLTQLVSILVSLVGLLLTWRAQAKSRRQQSRRFRPVEAVAEVAAGSHRQCFHYLFLLAAYYCGISIALNLSKQYSPAGLFSHPVVQFIERHLAPHEELSQPLSMANYLFLFHLALSLKGLLLIVQVTLQTVLIRSSCVRSTRELRQIYTFLMFANLSLWAMEICEQQQLLQQRQEPLDEQDRYKLVTLDTFSRFAASIVTLSHLYHGLVFMQH